MVLVKTIAKTHEVVHHPLHQVVQTKILAAMEVATTSSNPTHHPHQLATRLVHKLDNQTAKTDDLLEAKESNGAAETMSASRLWFIPRESNLYNPSTLWLEPHNLSSSTSRWSDKYAWRSPSFFLARAHCASYPKPASSRTSGVVRFGHRL